MTWVVFLVWMGLLAVAIVYGPRLQSVMVRGSTATPGSQSDQVQALTVREFPNLAPQQLALVMQSDSLDVRDPAYQSLAESLIQRVQAIPGVAGVTTAWNGGGDNLIGRDGRSTLAVVEVRARYFDLQGKVVPAMRLEAEGAPGGLKAYVTGEAAVNADLLDNIMDDVAQAERYVIPIVLVVLVIIFGSVVAALLPLGLGLLSVSVTMGLFYFYAAGHPVHDAVTSLVSMLGMGVGVDYALFLVTRFREELALGKEPAAAALRTVSTSGKAIAFSGATVVVSVAGLYLVNSPIIQSLALAMMLVVVVCVLAAVTLLPGLLALLGPRVNALRLPWLGGRDSQGGAQKFWHRWALAMMKRPWLFTAVSLLPLLLIAYPTLGMTTGWPSVSLLPPTAGARQGYHILEQQFSGGAVSPIEVLVQVPQGTVADADNLPRLYGLAEAIRRDPAVDRVVSHVSLQPEWGLADYQRVYLDEPARMADLPTELGKGAGGLQQAADALAEIQDGLTTLQERLPDLAAGQEQAGQSLTQLHGGIAQARDGVQQVADQLAHAASGFGDLGHALGLLDTSLTNAIADLDAMQPASKADPRYPSVYQSVATARAIVAGQPGAAGQPGTPGLAAQLQGGAGSVQEAVAGLRQVASSLGQAEDGLARIAAGVGLTAGATRQVAGALGQAEQGLAQVTPGIGQAAQSMKLAGSQSEPLDLKPLLTRGDLGLRLVAAGGGKQAEDLLPTLVNLDRGATVARLLVIPKGGPDASDTMDLVRRLRAALPGLAPTLQPKVGGTTAMLLDMNDQLDWALPRVIGVVLLVTFVVLLLLLRSLLLPLKAVVLNALSVAAAYGSLVLVFEKGYLAQWLGFTPLGYLESPIVVMLFAVLFGLSMDYEVFLLSRVKEAYDATGNNEEAVAVGLSRTAGIITGAATIMVLIFAVFASIGILTVKEMGFGLAVAVFLDASLIRIVLAPAFMRLAGEWNWWMPAWLDRLLPRLDIEH